MFEGIVFVAGVIALVVFYRMEARKIYTAYYAQKRKEFPWLEKWITNGVNPARARAKESVFFATVMALIVFVVLGFIAGAIVTKVIPDSAELLYNIVTALAMSGIIVVCVRVGKGQIKEPTVVHKDSGEAGLTLECPSCHCPHAWELVDKTTTFEDAEATKTTTESWTEDSDGNRVTGSTKIKTETKMAEFYNEHRYFKCLNCGHTQYTSVGRMADAYRYVWLDIERWFYALPVLCFRKDDISWNANALPEKKYDNAGIEWYAKFGGLLEEKAALLRIPQKEVTALNAAITELQRKAAGKEAKLSLIPIKQRSNLCEYIWDLTKEIILYRFQDMSAEERAAFGVPPNKWDPRDAWNFGQAPLDFFKTTEDFERFNLSKKRGWV